MLQVSAKRRVSSGSIYRVDNWTSDNESGQWFSSETAAGSENVKIEMCKALPFSRFAFVLVPSLPFPVKYPNGGGRSHLLRNKQNG